MRLREDFANDDVDGAFRVPNLCVVQVRQCTEAQLKLPGQPWFGGDRLL